jgi:exodeoxyribonuclease-5
VEIFREIKASIPVGDAFIIFCGVNRRETTFPYISMKYPNKLTNAAIALADDFRERIESASGAQLGEDSILDLAEWSSTLPNSRELFAGWCSALESGNIAPSDLPGTGKFMPPVSGSDDTRFTLLFDLIKAFVLEDPKTFWGEASPIETAHAAPETEVSVHAMEMEEAPPWEESKEPISSADEFELLVEAVEERLGIAPSPDEPTPTSPHSADPSAPHSVTPDPFAFLAMMGNSLPELGAETKLILPSEITPEESEKLFGHPPSKQIVRMGERLALKWNDEQSKAIKAVLNWYQNDTKRQQIFRLFGSGGSGKSSALNEISYVIQNGEGVKAGNILFATYTGKAAAVMRSKGMPASTIHSLIYKPQIDPVTGQIIGFDINDESDLTNASLLVCDEVSMVNEEMGRDLESFGVPILVVGDRGQLDPIKGEGYFISAEPDVELTKIERVALDNPLIWMANEVRLGNYLKPGKYGDSEVHRINGKIPPEFLLAADQIICGMNRTRTTLNRRYRKLMGYFDQDSEFPVLGDRLMCLKNNKDTGVLNGTQWHCGTPTIEKIWKRKDWRNKNSKMEETRVQGLHMRVRSCDLFDVDGNPLIVNTVCSTHHFDENIQPPNWKDISGTDEYTFAYAATVHKCVHPETMVETDQGFMPIRMVDGTGVVATHVGASSYDTKVENPASELVNVTTEYGYSVTLTPDHKSEVWRNGVPSMVEAEEIQVGDWQRVYIGSVVDVAGYAKMPKADFPIDVRSKVYPLPEVCTEDVAEFLGLMVADGTVYQGGLRLYKRHTDVSDRFAHLCRSLFSANPKRYESNQCNVGYGYEISSRFLADYFNQLGGLSPNKKGIPEVIYRSPLSVQAAFLRGFFEDGGVNLRGNLVDHIEVAQTLTTGVSMQHIQAMLLRQGIVSVLKVRKKCISIYIYGRYAAVFRDKIGFLASAKQQRLENCIDTERRYRLIVSKEEMAILAKYAKSSEIYSFSTCGYLSREVAKRIQKEANLDWLDERLNWVFVRVNSLEKDVAKTMCLRVPDVGRFLQNGFPHSNCQGSQFPYVVIKDESSVFRDQEWKHRYTAISRASERADIFID